MLLERLLSHLGVAVEPFATYEVDRGEPLWIDPIDSTTMHFVASGRGSLRTRRAAHALGTGWLAIVPPERPHTIEAESEAITVVCGHVVVSYGDGRDVFGALPDALAVDVHDDPVVALAFSSLLEEHRNPRLGSSRMQTALMDQCVVAVFREICQDPACDLPWLQAVEDPQLAPALDEILTNPAGRHSVDSLAATAHLSRAAFARRFSSAFGTAPMAYVSEVRLREGAQMLAAGQPVAHVAHTVGYSSRSHFSRTFTKRFGVAPGDYAAQPSDRPNQQR